MPLAAGTVVSGYVIERLLGAGGMGTVYLARHPTLPRSDALKVLSAELSLDDQFRVRFIREADLAATLSHPNIVTVFDRGQTHDGQLWIAMQYIEGTTAGDLPRSALTAQRVTHIITDVAKALDYAHARRVLHRDIKPTNFLVAHPGIADQERTLLADFGIARALDDTTTLTATGSLVGTASYSAPEAIEGTPVDHRADIYSLGCSLYRLLTGHTPYEEFRGTPAMLMAHVLQPIPRPTLIDPHLPPAIDEVIAHAMAKNPNDRYPSAGALAAATAAALTGPNTALTPGGSDTKNWTTPPLPYPTTPLPQHTPQGPPIPAYPSPAHHRASGPPPTSAGALRPRGRRKRGAIAAAVSLATALAVAAVAAILITGHKGGALAPYQPQSLTGKYGTIKLTQRPTTVAALGPGDPDAVLSLGLQPVAIGGFTGTPPNWLNDMLHSTPKRLTTLDLDALAATKPDLIIDTGDIDKPAYTKLAAIAPTLTQPADTTQQWVWQTQLRWIATALGRSDTAKMLLEHAATQQTTIKAEHPAFSGKTLTVISLTDTTTAAWAAPSPPTNYLEALGFTYNNSFKRGLNDPPEITISPGSFTWTEAQLADVMVLLRSDKAAGSGGFAGLPAQFNTYTGTLIIVDDPATITALTTGGPAATTYLNTTLATKIANQIH